MAGDAGGVAATSFEAWRRRDFATFRALLADEVTFRGPLGEADGADDCVAGIRGMSQIVTDILVHRRCVDGPDVLTRPIRVTFDARALAPPPASRAAA